MNASQMSNLITGIRNSTVKLLEAINELRALAAYWVATDAGNVLEDKDALGDNEGIKVADLAAVIGTSLPEIEAFLAKGHATNLYRLVK